MISLEENVTTDDENEEWEWKELTADDSLLLHPSRREIYQYLCKSAGNYFFDIVNNLSEIGAQSTIKHHLNRLVEYGLITTLKIGGRRIYYPTNLRNEEVEKSATILKKKGAMEIYKHVVNNSNSSLRDIATETRIDYNRVRKLVREMDEAGIFKTVTYRSKRVCNLGEIGRLLLQGTTAVITKAFRTFLLDKIITDDCISADVVESAPNRLVIDMSCSLGDSGTLEIELGGWEI